MTSGAEAVKAALRRSLLLIVFCVVAGAVAMDFYKQSQGPNYEAGARVLISTVPLSRIVTGTAPAFIDPQRIEDTARALASSPEIYTQAAGRTGGALGSAGDLRAATRVTGGRDDILVFVASSSKPERATAIANVVAEEYIKFRATLSGSSIDKTITQLSTRLRALGPNEQGRAELQQQLDRFELLRTLNSADAVLIERADSAGKTTPRPLRDTILGGLIGLVVGLLFAGAREAIDTKVRSESDVENLLATPVLATVRTLPRRARLVTYGRHEALFADTYGLLASQLAQAREGSERTVLAVTSAVPQEGKTTTAANLAVALARRGMDVLLADFDFRRPAAAELFHIPKEAPGAVQILSGKTRVRESLWWVSLNGSSPQVGRDATEGPVEGSNGAAKARRTFGSLHVLPAGGAMRPQAIAHSAWLAMLLRDLRGRHEFVVLDTPPALLTVEMAELGRLIDLVLVVVRQGRATQRTLRSLGKQAQAWPAELVGAVLTDAPPQEAYATYYYGGR